MEGFKNKVVQANEEIQHLKELVAQKEDKINQLKKKQSGIQEAISGVQQMKAMKQQMVIQNKGTYEELQVEFTGIDIYSYLSPSLSLLFYLLSYLTT